ncbi:hypothetical protein [Legionella sp. W05-934-2]|jgi:hypothetical protein|uniref:hypothetical protein n=1 Tax=Legionella sp. W05-934-2 TaxID=1198649 RepID=UPI0034624C99
MTKGRARKKENQRNQEIQAEIKKRNNLCKKDLLGLNLSQAQSLLKTLKDPIKYGGSQANLDDIPSEYPTPGSKDLRGHIRTLQKNIELHKATQEKLSELIEQLKTGLGGINDENEYKETVSSLVSAIEQDTKTYLDKPMKDLESSFKKFSENVAERFLNSKADFQPKVWHGVADVFISMLNGLKAIGRALGVSSQRMKLFSEQKAESEVVNSAIQKLSEDVRPLISPSQ